MRTEQDDLDSVALLGNKRADRANSSGNGSIFCHMVQCLSSLSVLVLLAACVTMVALTFKNVLDVKQVQNQQEQVACSFAILASHQPLAEAVQKNQLPCARQILRDNGKALINKKNAEGFTPLMISAGLGQTQMVDMLLTAGADVHALDDTMGASALHKAVQSGNVDVIQLLLNKGSFLDLNSAYNGHTPLQDATWHKKVDAVKLLLARASNLNVKTHWGGDVTLFNSDAFSPMNSNKDRAIRDIFTAAFASRKLAVDAQIQQQELISAVKQQNLNSVKSIIARPGYNLNEIVPNTGERNDGYTAVLMASRDGQDQMVKSLLDAGADPKIVDYWMKSTVLHKAGALGHPNVARVLITYPKVMEMINDQGPYNGYTCLHDAIWHNNKECAQIFIDAGARLDLKTVKGQTPYQLAKEYGYTEIMTMLQAKGGHIDRQETYPCDTLSNAALANNLTCAKILLRNGVDVNWRNAQGVTPLMIAAGLGSVQMVDLFLSAGADVTMLDSIMGATALHRASQSGSSDVIRLLLNKGAFIDFNAAFNGHTPLMDAVWHKQVEAVRALLDNGANIYIPNRYGRTAEQFNLPAASPVDDVLVKAIADLFSQKKQRETTLMRSQLLALAVAQNNITEVDRLLQVGYPSINEKVPIVISADTGYTPLLIACRDGRADLVSKLLAAGASIKDRDYLMKSAAGHKVAYNGMHDAAAVLVKHPDFELDPQGFYNGYSPLHDATWHGHSKTVKVLLDAGANTQLRTVAGQTALDIAREFGYADIEQMLLTKSK